MAVFPAPLAPAPLAAPAFGGLAPAGLWRRTGAALIDAVLLALVWDLGAMWLALGLWGLRDLPRTPGEWLIVLAAVLAMGVAMRLAYTVVWVGGCGQTPGRMAAGIAVVDRGGRTPGYRRAFVGWLAGFVNLLTLGLAGLVFLFARDGRGLSDRLAGTKQVLRPRALAHEDRRRL
jgi:uncharacterized RDD family membrane protein YckC